MPGRSVNLTTLFRGRLRPPKRLTSTSCTYFRQPETDNCPSWKSGRRNESMLPDRVSNPGPLTYEWGTLPAAPFVKTYIMLHVGTAYRRLRGEAIDQIKSNQIKFISKSAIVQCFWLHTMHRNMTVWIHRMPLQGRGCLINVQQVGTQTDRMVYSETPQVAHMQTKQK